jgi:hypothetical protein
VSIVVACISAGVAGIAIWQARSAKKAARAAERQADAAEAAAQAAQEQVELMRRQLDAEDANRREARGPEFDIKFRGSSRGLPERTGQFEFAQNSGPALQTIQVSVTGEGIRGLYDPQAPTTEGPPSAQPAVEVGPVSKGGKVAVHVAVDPAVQAQCPSGSPSIATPRAARTPGSGRTPPTPTVRPRHPLSPPGRPCTAIGEHHDRSPAAIRRPAGH